MRKRLSDTRKGRTQHFTIIARNEDGDGVYEVKGYIQSGEYDDGTLGEVFVKMGKPGSSEAVYDAWATSASIALQHGAPVEELLGKHVNTRFEPSGAVRGVDGISRCTSPLDLMSRWLISKYGRAES